MEGVVAMGEGEEPEARRAITSRSSKTFICPVLKIKLVAELQMTSAPLIFPTILVRFPTEQDYESTIPINSLPVVNFKMSLYKLPYK